MLEGFYFLLSTKDYNQVLWTTIQSIQYIFESYNYCFSLEYFLYVFVMSVIYDISSTPLCYQISQDIEALEGNQAWIIGIVEKGDRSARIIDKPRVIEVNIGTSDGQINQLQAMMCSFLGAKLLYKRLRLSVCLPPYIFNAQLVPIID